MKKPIFISGILSANLMMFGSLFKVMHWPGASIMMVLSAILFAFYFLPSALLSSYKEQKETKSKWIYIAAFITFFIGITGIIFKVQHWPGAGIFLLIGIPLPFILFLPLYLYHTRNEKKNIIHYSGIMFGMIFLAVISVLLSTNTSIRLLQRVEANIAENQQMIDLINRSQESQKLNKQITSGEDLFQYIEELKCKIYTNATAMPCTEILNIQNLRIYNQSIPRATLINGNENSISILKEKINRFKEDIVKLPSTSKELADLTTDLLNTETYTSDNGERLHWENSIFHNSELIFMYDVLTEMQSNVRLIENESNL